MKIRVGEILPDVEPQHNNRLLLSEDGLHFIVGDFTLRMRVLAQRDTLGVIEPLVAKAKIV